jgi:hypothetical protein
MRSLTEQEKNAQARRCAHEANAELDRVRALMAQGKADIHDVRAAQRDAFYWNQVVNNLNGYI